MKMKCGDPLLLSINGDSLIEENEDCELDQAKQYILWRNAASVRGSFLIINEKLLNESLNNGISKYESHEGFDYIFLNIPDESDLHQAGVKVGIFFSKNLLAFISEEQETLFDLLNETKNGAVKNLSLGKILYMYFEKLISDDTEVQNELEESVSELEEKLMTSSGFDCSKSIIVFRKKVLTLRRYYEQFVDITSLMLENENEIISKRDLKYFRIHASRVDKLYHGTLNLRDYLTQIREAYQAQVDINLNSIMKLFTVLTAIFMPLTLLVGWYGMNLQMPEFTWKYGYLFVIILSVIVVIFCLIAFKRRKWF